MRVRVRVRVRVVPRLDLEHLVARRAVLHEVEALGDARLDLARVLRRRELLELDVPVGEQPEGEGLPLACSALGLG